MADDDHKLYRIGDPRPRPEVKIPRWMFHVCPLDKDCRKWGSPWRIGIRVPGWYLGIAMRPRDRFASIVQGDVKGRWTEVQRYPVP